MTRKEALKIAYRKRKDTANIEREFLNTVIDALSQEPCEKCEVGNPCLYCKHDFERGAEDD